MKEFCFTVTKTGYVNVEADSFEDAEAKLQENFGHLYVITDTGEELSMGYETTGEVEELQPLKCNPIESNPIIMNRKEYELVYDALKNYHVYMDKDQRLLAEQILDDLYYPREVKDRLDTDKTGQEFREELDVFDEIVADAEEALANESGIKSLNFRQ